MKTNKEKLQEEIAKAYPHLIPTRDCKKHRSLRLQKKLKLGKFTEYGISSKINFNLAHVSEGYWDELTVRFQDEIITPNKFIMGGTVLDCFITAEDSNMVIDEDMRRKVAAWFSAIPAVVDVKVKLVDAWSFNA